MDSLKYPVIIGCKDKADKVCVIAKDKRLGGYALFLCRAKTDVNYGDTVEKDNIGDVIFQLNFCKLESARVFLKSVERLVEEMEKEHDCEGI